MVERGHPHPRWQDANLEPSGHQTPDLRALERSVRAVDPTATVWRGSMLPTDRQGIKLLGTPLGHPDFVARHLRSVTEEHQVLLQRIPRVRDLQSAWLLLLHCASVRANYFLRAVDPGSSVDFARAHDDDIWQYTCDILQVDPVQARSVKDVASLPLVLGGLGLRSAERVRVSAFWASWADCIPTIHARHPVVADVLVRQLEGHPHTPCLRAASEAAWSLHGILGWSPPSWNAVRDGTRPETRQPEEYEPGSTRGWQHEAASRVDQRFRNEDLFARLTDSGQALVRSQGGPGAGLALSTCPTCRITRIDPQLFRVIAGVAFHSTLVATTVQLALGLGSWEGGCTLWRR